MAHPKAFKCQNADILRQVLMTKPVLTKGGFYEFEEFDLPIKQTVSPGLRLTISGAKYPARSFIISAKINDVEAGYAIIRQARNDYVTRACRIGYICTFSQFQRRGVASAIVDGCLSTGSVLVPSGAFGAGSKLTSNGWLFHKRVLERTRPDWLPEDWEALYREARMVRGDAITPMGAQAMPKLIQLVADNKIGQPDHHNDDFGYGPGA
jgi:hypothetical protein